MLVVRFNPLSVSFQTSDMFGFASGFCWGMGSVMLRRFSSINYVATVFGQYAAGTILATLVALILSVPVPSASVLLSALPITFITASCIFLPSILIIFRVNQYVSPGLVGILMLSEVVFAVASAWLLLDEALNVWQWSGVVAILATGVWLGVVADSEPANISKVTVT